MNVQELFDAIGEAGECRAATAQQPMVKKISKRWYLGAVAAVLAVCVTLGVLMGQPPSKPKRLPITVNEGVSCQITTAKHPDYVPYPSSALLNVAEKMEAKEQWETAFAQKWDSLTDADVDIDAFYKQTAEAFLTDTQGENKLYSPLNVYIALAMVAEIADNDSREQILNLLQVKSVEELRKTVSLLWEAHYYDDSDAKTLLANSLWLRDDMGYVEETLKTLSTAYYASAYQGVMGSQQTDDLFKEWLKENTGGMLDDYIDGMELSADTVLAMASTLYFQADWDSFDVFDADCTTAGLFYSPSGETECDYMVNSLSKIRYEGDDFSAISLDFSTHSRSFGNMWFVLPEEGVTPETLIKEGALLDCVTDPEHWENQKEEDVQITVPKLDVSSSFDLQSGLESLGVKDVFDRSKSDFSYLTDKEHVYIDKAEHTVGVSIDESGCQAAAYTKFLFRDGSSDRDWIEFTVDRPFVFVITSQAGVPLFIGVVNQV